MSLTFLKLFLQMSATAVSIWVSGLWRYVLGRPLGGKKLFSVEVEPGKEGETGVRRSTIDPSHLLETWYSDVTTLYELFNFSVAKFAENNSLGWRELVKEHKQEREISRMVGGKEVKEKRGWTTYEMSEYKWMSYRQLGERVKNVASGLVSKEVGLPPGSSHFGIFCNTCPEWLVILHACSSQSVVVSTVYANLGEEGLQHAINEADITHLLTSADLFPVIANVIDNCPSLSVIIYKDSPDQKSMESIRSKRSIKFISFAEVEKCGQNSPAIPKPPKPSDVMMIMYTSGSTGNPKGVVILHKNLIAVIASGFKCIDVHPSDVYIAFLPLAHVLELVVENALLLAGASLGFATARTLTAANMTNSKGDIKELRPTIMAGVPEVWERIRRGATDKLKKRPVVKKIFDTALAIKKHLSPYFGFKLPGIDIIFSQFNKEVGGRLRLILSGGAPIASNTQTFLRMAFSINCIQGYGLTETCGVIMLQMPDHCTAGVVGGPIPCTETKLIDIPEMNYTCKDKPRPRGELLARGNNITAGYFKNEEETKKVYGPDGWFATGDVGELQEDGTYKIIDRKKNLVKLSAGEYIALEHLESVYKHSDFVENICVYADSEKAFPIAIILPNKSYMEHWADHNKIPDKDIKSLVHNEQVLDATLNSLKQVGKKNRLAGFEIVQGCYITSDEWTTENDMLTAAFKLKRRNIVQKYKDQIDRLYQSAM